MVISYHIGGASPHLTLRLVLELLAAESTGHGSQRSSRSSHTRTSPRPRSIVNAYSIEYLQSLLLSAGCRGWSEDSVSGTSSASTAEMTSDDSLPEEVPARLNDMPWEEEELSAEDEEDGFDFVEDRGRLCANVGTCDGSCDESFFAPASPDRRNPDEFVEQGTRCVSALDELDHPLLTGAVAALHGYAASGGDRVFLEKAYDLARDIAGSKHELGVAFNACRMALAAGYVHTTRNSSRDLARQFVLEHSLPKLAISLKPYWTRGDLEGQTLAEELEWEECMQSLLEVASSVSLLAEEKDIFSLLDEKTGLGLTKVTIPNGRRLYLAIGLYCITNPDILSQYPEVGGVCARSYLASVDSEKQSRIAADLEDHVDPKAMLQDKQPCLFNTE